MDTRLGFFSAYSFLYGVHGYDKLLDRALSDGVKCVAVSDLDNLYGVHKFIEEAKERKIRPIIGAALSCKNEAPLPSGLIYCFAENRAGYGRLCEILTERNKDRDSSDSNESYGSFDPLPLLLENSAEIVLASSNSHVLGKLTGRVKRLYAAITPDDLSGLESHKTLSLPLAFLDGFLFLEEGDYYVHKTLRAIGLNKTIGNLEKGDYVPEGTGKFKSSLELKRRLNSWPDAYRGTREISELCHFNEIFDGFIFPSYGKSPGQELRERSFKGAALRYGELGDCEIDRINYELEIIEKMGFSPYFLVMDDIVKMATERRSCGRGSGAASIISYSLGITNVDPIAHNLYFERFLNESRPDPPDIDVDFAWDERDALIQNLIKSYGEENCARVANHNFFRRRSALRETAKAHGYSDPEISQMERRPAAPEGGNTESGLWKDVKAVAARIQGLPRGMSMHCGGLILTPDPISRYAPIEKSLQGYPLLAWEKDGAEAAGLVKIDLLGNRSLAVIRDAVKNINEQLADNGADYDLEGRLGRAIYNKATIKALASGDSMGVFYIESPAMRQLQRKTGKGDFDHIVIHSSIIRPAANKFISEYVERLKGKKWKALHPRLENILNESYGILCYQEDVSKTAIALAGFNESDADKLRKVIAKKAGGAKLKIHEEAFFTGCRKNGVAEESIKKIWAMMLSFDGYSFCKPHSASYAMVSFQSAYLRVHHPAEFMAAVLSNQGGFYRPHAYISEARRMGLKVIGPDINLSKWKYYGRDRELVVGLMSIKGLSASGVQNILNERTRGGAFLSLDDFRKRIKIGRDDIIALCPAGAFDSISGGLKRSHQARYLLSAINESLKSGTKNKVKERQGDLFAADSSVYADSSFFHGNSSYSNPFSAGSNQIEIIGTRERELHESELIEEYRSLGFLRDHHPLRLWKDKIKALNRIKACDIPKYVGYNRSLLGWPVTQKEVWTKDGLTMSFLSLEDETAMYETVIFPDIYDKYSKLLFDQQPLLISGRIMNDQGALSLEVKKIEALT